MREGPSIILGGRETLPSTLKPTHYYLLVEPDFIYATEYSGAVVIDIDVVAPTSSISLNASKDLKILKTVVAVGLEKVQVVGTRYDAVRETLTFELERKLKRGEAIVLKIEFLASHLHLSHGFYRSPFVGEGGENKWMFSTHMEPTDARMVFPCFDEPALKAAFTISIIAPKALSASPPLKSPASFSRVVFGNMPIAIQVPIGDSKKLTTFDTTPVMSTYILCFVVGDLKYIETNSFRIPIKLLTTVDKPIEHGRRSIELAARTLEAFEMIFDISFPLPKVDLVSVSSEQGAMENWGLVTFNESSLLVDEKESTVLAWRRASSTIVHELAHQWFGNIVTMDFWEGIWLNEGFATWAELTAWDLLGPAEERWPEFSASGFQGALVLDSNKASHPIEVPVNKTSEFNQIFDDISYLKGCSIIRMISTFLGPVIFLKGIQHYLKKHAYSNTTTSDLWESLSHVSGVDVGNIMTTWTKKVGYPVIDVTEDKSASTITLTQHRFLLDGTCSSDDDKTIYPTPLRLFSEDGINNEIILTDRSKTIKISLEAYKLNAGQTGFFRVSYPPERLQKLGSFARTGLLSVQDRIGLVSDALAMAISGHRNAKTSSVLELIEGFGDEQNLWVWTQLLNTVEAIRKLGAFKPDQAPLRNFQTRLIKKILLKKGWRFSQDEESQETLLKQLLFSHATEVPEVIQAAREMFAKFMDGDEEAIDVNIQQSVFEIVIANGGIKEYEAVFNASRHSSSLNKRDICLGSLGYTRDTDLLSRTLDLILQPDHLARRDISKIMTSLATHAKGIKALWTWMKTNYAELQSAFGSGLGAFARLLSRATEGMATREQYEDVKCFFAGKDTETFDAYLAQSLDGIRVRANWFERDEDDVKQWLLDHGYSVCVG